MINWIWGVMMTVSVICGIINGRIKEVCDAVLSGGTQAIDLCLTMLSMMVLWSGLTAIMQCSGLSDWFGKLLSPLIRLMFPELRNQPRARNAIAMNMAANVLGLGNAATPLGLKAMAELKRIHGTSTKASDSMVTFVVLNSVSIQLIPTGLAILRTRYHSQNPMEILGPIWFVSILSTVLAVVVTVMLNRRRTRYG